MADERALRVNFPGLAAKVVALKDYQQRRVALTNADLLATTRYGAAARFFLNELYGPGDFSHRDIQFARVVPELVRLFPSEVVPTVTTVAQLHALSEMLDTAMANHAERAADWELQIALTLEIASRRDRLTRKPLYARVCD